jgi:type I restriction enzyme S subunit
MLREKTLGEVTVLLTDGSHNPPQARENGIPMLSARNIIGNDIDFEAGYRFISESDFLLESKRAEPRAGDVLLTIVGTIGRTSIVRSRHLPFALQRSVAILRPGDDMLPDYLCYWLESPIMQKFLKEKSRGTAQKGVYLKTLKSALIKFPCITFQRKICKKLDEQLSALNHCVEQLSGIERKLKQARAVPVQGADIVSGKTEDTACSVQAA